MPIDWSRGKPLHLPQPSDSILDPDTGRYVDVVNTKNPETGAFRSVAKDGSGKVYDWGTPTKVDKPQPMPTAAAQRIGAPTADVQPHIGAPTASKQTGRFAGSKLLGMAGKTALKGFIAYNTIMEIGSLLDSDQEKKEQAREMAKNLVDQGYTDYDSVMTLAQSNPGLESAIGDIGVSDYAKTAAGVGSQAGDILAMAGIGAGAGAAAGPVGMTAGALIGGASALLGSAAQVDLQRKKAKRNEAFREQFTNELIQRGLA